MDNAQTRYGSDIPAYKHRLASQLWDSGDGFDLSHVFEVCETKCHRIRVHVLNGVHITKGSLGDFVDTPDPYLLLTVPNTPNGTKRTATVDNVRNPTWDNIFYFFINPDIHNEMRITLLDANCLLPDSTLGTVTVTLDDIKLHVETDLMIMFRRGSKAYLKILKEENSRPDLRFGLALCKEEKEFLLKRRCHVLEGMKTFLGDRDSPKNEKEVPTVAVLGSGGGIRALVGYSGVFSALQEMKLFDCMMFIASLSGSSWFLSFLYSHPDFPKSCTKQFQAELREILAEDLSKYFNPINIYNCISAILKKSISGQPVSLTDLFGHLLGDMLLRKNKEAKLSQQRKVLESGQVPLPLYTCINVKKDVSARVFQEFLEFNPFEIGVNKYGTYTKPENFGCKFYLGNIVRRFEEPPLHFLQGIWGSAYSIQLKRLIKEICRMNYPNVDLKEEEEDEDIGNYTPRHDLGDDDIDNSSDDDLESHDSDKLDSEDLVSSPDPDYTSLAWKTSHWDSKEISAVQHTLDFITTEIYFEERDRRLETFIRTRYESDSDTQSNRRNSLKEQKKTRKVEKYKAQKSLLEGVVENLLNSTIPNSRVLRAGIIYNAMRGLHLQNTFPISPLAVTTADDEDDFKGAFEPNEMKSKKLFLVDSGLTFNLPFPVLLRSQRAVDLFLCFDFSERMSDDHPPFEEIILAEKWAKLMQIRFPPVLEVVKKLPKDEPLKECYVFENETDPYCPVVLYFPLVNNKFREFKAPGIKRETKEEKDFGSFSIFSDPKKSYRTFKFNYSNEDFDRIAQLVEFNLKYSEPLVREYMKKAVVRKRKLLPQPVMSLDQLRNMKLRPRNKEMMEKLKTYMQCMEEE